MKAKETIKGDLSLELETKLELTQELYKNIPISIYSIIIVATVLGWELSGYINASILGYWYFSILAITLSRALLLFWYHKTKTKKNLHYYHCSLCVLGAFLTAVLWGLLGSILMPNDLVHQLYTLLLISGVLAGSVQSLSASYVASIGYVCFTLLPILVWEAVQVYQGAYIYSGILLTMSLFFIYSLRVARRNFKVLTTNIEIKHENLVLYKNLKVYTDQVEKQSTHDLLTNLFNRRYLEEFLNKEIARESRQKNNIIVIMVDIDYFKNINDNFGHEAGDRVLQELAQFFTKNTRTSDVICRYGGDEFIIVMPETTLHDAHARAESLRTQIKSLQFRNQKISVPGITLSFGIAEYPKNGSTAMEVINAADAALYLAKKEGRDRISIAK